MKPYYVAGLALTVLSVFFLIWLSLAVGINGPDGESFDRIYLGVLGIGLIVAASYFFRAKGMSYALFAMAAAQVAVAAIALLSGQHLHPSSPWPEIVGVNGIFVVLFFGAGWLFRKA